MTPVKYIFNYSNIGGWGVGGLVISLNLKQKKESCCIVPYAVKDIFNTHFSHPLIYWLWGTGWNGQTRRIKS